MQEGAYDECISGPFKVWWNLYCDIALYDLKKYYQMSIDSSVLKRSPTQPSSFSICETLSSVEEIAGLGNRLTFSSLQQFVTKFSICCLIVQQISPIGQQINHLGMPSK